MTLKICAFVVLVFSPLIAVADICSDQNISHPDMINCMMKDLTKGESQFRSLVEKGIVEYGVPKGFYRLQRDSLHERCMIYSNLGGQRAEVLEVQCELDGVKALSDFLGEYMRAEDVN